MARDTREPLAAKTQLASCVYGAGTYVWAEDVVGDRRLVDGGVLIRLEVDQGILRDALGAGFFCLA